MALEECVNLRKTVAVKDKEIEELKKQLQSLNSLQQNLKKTIELKEAALLG